MCGPQVRAAGNAGQAELTLGRDTHKPCSCSTDWAQTKSISLFPVCMVTDLWQILAGKPMARLVQKYLHLPWSNTTVTPPAPGWGAEDCRAKVNSAEQRRTRGKGGKHECLSDQNKPHCKNLGLTAEFRYPIYICPKQQIISSPKCWRGALS